MSADSIEKIADDSILLENAEAFARIAEKRGWHNEADCLRQCAERLRSLDAQGAKDAVDAARYRWFRDNADANYQNGNIDFWLYYDGIHMQQGEELDKAIDDAIAKDTQP